MLFLIKKKCTYKFESTLMLTHLKQYFIVKKRGKKKKYQVLKFIY